MRKVGFVYDDAFLLHASQSSHPEHPDRLNAIVASLKSGGLWDKLKHIEPHAASVDELELIHSKAYIEEVKQTSGRESDWLDPDTYVCKDSFRVASLAAGGVIDAVQEVVRGEVDSAFCAVRPPGHHAENDAARGFCLFNNIAIGAAYARSKLGVERAAILDWDVHHGNGTQSSFYSDPTVHYTSLHQYPYYPGSGAAAERGAGDGLGFTLDFPLPAGTGDDEVMAALEVFWIKEMDKFKPNLIMISAGFDGHAEDHFADWRLTDNGYIQIMRIAMRSARAHCGGKIVSVLEGGYYLPALSRCVGTHIKELLSR